VPAWKQIPLTGTFLGAGWAFSPARDEVVFTENATSTPSAQITLASLVDGTRTVLVPPQAGLSFSDLTFLPDGRGLLYKETGGTQSAVRYISRQGGASQLIASSVGSSLGGSAFVVDPPGCLVLYQKGKGSAPGIYLASIPQ